MPSCWQSFVCSTSHARDVDNSDGCQIQRAEPGKSQSAAVDGILLFLILYDDTDAVRSGSTENAVLFSC